MSCYKDVTALDFEDYMWDVMQKSLTYAGSTCAYRSDVHDALAYILAWYKTRNEELNLHDLVGDKMREKVDYIISVEKKKYEQD